MKKVLVILCSVIVSASLAGCVAGKAPWIGKGKAPAPVVTKG
jgi:hypothetical protein